MRRNLFSRLGQSLDIIEEYEGLSLIGRYEFCSERQPAEVVEKKLAMSPSYPLTLVKGVGMIPNINIHPLDIASGIRRGDNSFFFTWTSL